MGRLQTDYYKLWTGRVNNITHVNKSEIKVDFKLSHLESSVADPDPFDTDPDPAFRFDSDPDPDPAFLIYTDSNLESACLTRIWILTISKR